MSACAALVAKTSASLGLYTEIVGLGKLLMVVGVAFIAAGAMVTFAGRLPFKLGRLPGDIYIHGRNSTFIFPLTTCILLSAVLTLAMWLLRR
jgi:hypothetical protein